MAFCNVCKQKSDSRRRRIMKASEQVVLGHCVITLMYIRDASSLNSLLVLAACEVNGSVQCISLFVVDDVLQTVHAIPVMYM